MEYWSGGILFAGLLLRGPDTPSLHFSSPGSEALPRYVLERPGAAGPGVSPLGPDFPLIARDASRPDTTTRDESLSAIH